MAIFSPFPSNLDEECKNCASILTSLVEPKQAFGADKVIPPWVLKGAKGLAILKVVKAGFVGSVRGGSGLVVARLLNGSWSPPSAIKTIGAGFGSQIGFEFTEFVLVLNDAAAVRSFAQSGSLTFSGNLSLAAGPLGRNAEAGGAASLKGVAGIFSYSRTKGLFAGLSIEGSGFVERKTANEKFYGRPCQAQEILGGSVQPPPQAMRACSVLSNVLQSDSFNMVAEGPTHNNEPQFGAYDHGGWEHGDANYSNANGNAGFGNASYGDVGGYGNANNGADLSQGKFNRASTFAGSPSTQKDEFSPPSRSGTWKADKIGSPAVVADSMPEKSPPPKPNIAAKAAMLNKGQAVALWSFDQREPGDLGFKKGETITVLKKTESDNEWWTGMIGTRHGIFPGNYVRMKT